MKKWNKNEYQNQPEINKHIPAQKTKIIGPFASRLSGPKSFVCRRRMMATLTLETAHVP